MSQVFAKPHQVAIQVVKDPNLPFIAKAKVLRKIPRRIVKFKMRFEPWAAMEAEGYPSEMVRLEVTPDGQVAAYPLSVQPREWEHRYPAGGRRNAGPLCLFFPGDPTAITWSPETGSFEEILGIISRHLQAEEFHRREGSWPWEDAPHGQQAARGPRSRLMRDLARGGAS